MWLMVFLSLTTPIVLQVVAISPHSNEPINVSLPSLDSPSGLSYIVLPADIINNVTVKSNGSCKMVNFVTQILSLSLVCSAMCQLGIVSTAIEDLGSLLPPQGAYAITPPPPSNPQW